MSTQPFEWHPIASAPKPNQWLTEAGLPLYLIACLHQHRDADGALTSDIKVLWAHVVGLTSVGWVLNSAGFKGLHGNCGFPINDNATHWAVLPGIRPFVEHGQ